MKHRQRIEACLNGRSVDRPPVALWRHFPVDDQTPESLAAATINFQHTYDFDIVKVTPASSFCLKDWGVKDEWHGAVEGTREYADYLIRSPEDWQKLWVLDPEEGYLANQIACLRMVIKELGPDVPVIQTIFSPLAQAKNLVGGKELLVHIRRYPDYLRAGLQIIEHSIVKFIESIRKTGVSGVFYAVQHANYHLLSENEYDEFGKIFDLEIMKSTQNFWLNMLHLHGENIMFDKLSEYPVNVINWHDRDTPPNLAEAHKITTAILCGGLQRDRTMVLSTPAGVTKEAMEAIQATNLGGLILATGCVLPTNTPRANILAARKSVEIGH